MSTSSLGGDVLDAKERRKPLRAGFCFLRRTILTLNMSR
jgi:hypothetical protein